MLENEQNVLSGEGRCGNFAVVELRNTAANLTHLIFVCQHPS
jgi:hypothetical protein